MSAFCVILISRLEEKGEFMPHRKWLECVLLKLKQAKLETGGLFEANTRVSLSGYEITQLIETIEPFESLPLFRWHDYKKTP